MSPFSSLCPAAFGSLLVLLVTGACSPTREGASHPPAASVLTEVGDHYAELERIADSVSAVTESADATGAEEAQVVARNLAGRIGQVRGGFEAITMASVA